MKDLPEDVIEEHKLSGKFTNNGYVYVEVQKGIHGLPHSGLIVHQIL